MSLWNKIKSYFKTKQKTTFVIKHFTCRDKYIFYLKEDLIITVNYIEPDKPVDNVSLKEYPFCVVSFQDQKLPDIQITFEHNHIDKIIMEKLGELYYLAILKDKCISQLDKKIIDLVGSRKFMYENIRNKFSNWRNND